MAILDIIDLPFGRQKIDPDNDKKRRPLPPPPPPPRRPPAQTPPAQSQSSSPQPSPQRAPPQTANLSNAGGCDNGTLFAPKDGNIGHGATSVDAYLEAYDTIDMPLTNRQEEDYVDDEFGFMASGRFKQVH